jgi:hypothetical protein
MADPRSNEPMRDTGRKRGSRLSILRLSSPQNHHISRFEDDQDHRATDNGSANSPRPSRHDSFASLMNQGTPPPGYEFSILSDSNSTMSNITGAGRTVGRLLWGVGRRLEPALDRLAFRVVGTFSGSNIMLRTSNGSPMMINRAHADLLKESWTIFADPETGLVKRSNLVRLFGVRHCVSMMSGGF